MIRFARPARYAAAAGILAVAFVATAAHGQRSQPRQGVGAPDPMPNVPRIPYPGANVTFEPQGHTVRRDDTRHRLAQRPVQPPVVYLIPVPVGGGYGDHGYGYGYGAPPVRGGVYDTNGRPMSSIGFDAGPAADAVPSYTPDLSGSPYTVLEGGTMLVDLPSGERRSVPSCAAEDPDGRPRTIFYQGGGTGVVLRAGQRGRVQGAPAAGARTCYTVDSWGRMILSY